MGVKGKNKNRYKTQALSMISEEVGVKEHKRSARTQDKEYRKSSRRTSSVLRGKDAPQGPRRGTRSSAATPEVGTSTGRKTAKTSGRVHFVAKAESINSQNVPLDHCQDETLSSEEDETLCNDPQTDIISLQNNNTENKSKQTHLKYVRGTREVKSFEKLPLISNKKGFNSQFDHQYSHEDVLDLPFGGRQKLCETTLMAAAPATNIVYMVNRERKKRLKRKLDAEIAAVNERVKQAIDYSELFEEEDDIQETEDDEDSTTSRKFDAKSRRVTIVKRNEMLNRMRERIEESHQRMVLISDVNSWIQYQQKELERDLKSEEEMEDEETNIRITNKQLVQKLEEFTECAYRVNEIGQKFIEAAKLLINLSTKGRVNKMHVIDEKSLLSSKVKWDQAVANVTNLLEDASRWVRGSAFKSAFRNGKKQYRELISGVEKRLKELEDKSKFADDLQLKLAMSKEMLESMSKQSEENKTLVDQLQKELAALKSELLAAQESNKKLTEQLGTMESKIEGLEAELQKNKATPPPQPSEPVPKPAGPSESTTAFQEKAKQDLDALKIELEEYRALVNSLSDRIDDLLAELAKEQQQVQSLQESLEKLEARLAQPVVTVPREPVQATGDSHTDASYYKTLIKGMKKDFQTEIEKLKDYINKEQGRNDAVVRRLETSHKEHIQSIMKDCIRVLRAIVHFRDQITISLEKEGFPDSAKQLKQLPKLFNETLSNEPKDVLVYMAENTVDYLQSMEIVLNHTLFAIKVMQKSGGTAPMTKSSITKEKVFEQMENRMEEIKKPSKIRAAMMSPKRKKPHGRRKDRQMIRKLETSLAKTEGNYNTLLDRYKVVWKMYSDQKEDMDTLEKSCQSTVQQKVRQRERELTMMYKNQLKIRKARNTEHLQMTIADQKQNLKLLDKAYRENKISQDLHQMTTSLLQHAMEIPRKRLHYLVKRYSTHCAVKEAETELMTALDKENLSLDQQAEVMEYLGTMQRRLRSGLVTHHNKMKKLESERRGIYHNMWNVFNDVLVDTGVLLIQPVFPDKPVETQKKQVETLERQTETTPELFQSLLPRSRKKARNKFTYLSGVRTEQFMEMPSGLVGNNIMLSKKQHKPLWQREVPGELEPNAQLTTPMILGMDINRHKIIAKRALTEEGSPMYTVAASRSYTISNVTVDYINSTLVFS